MPAAAPLRCYFLVDSSGVRRLDQSFPNFAHSSERVLFLHLYLVSVSSKQIECKRQQNLIERCFYTQGFPGTLWRFFPWLHDCLYWYMRTANVACVFESCFRMLLGTTAENSHTCVCFFHNFLYYALLSSSRSFKSSQISFSRNWRIGKISPGIKYARMLRPGGLPVTAMELRVSVNQPQLFVSEIFSIKIHTGGKSCAWTPQIACLFNTSFQRE